MIMLLVSQYKPAVTYQVACSLGTIVMRTVYHQVPLTITQEVTLHDGPVTEASTHSLQHLSFPFPF